MSSFHVMNKEAVYQKQSKYKLLRWKSKSIRLQVARLEMNNYNFLHGQRISYRKWRRHYSFRIS